MGKVIVDDDDDVSEPIAQTPKTNTSPTQKKPLTPASDHPLMDLINSKESKRGEFMDDDDSDEQDDAVVKDTNNKTQTDIGSIDVVVDDDDANQINNNQISNKPEVAESDSHEPQHTADDERNNNMVLDESDDEGADRGKLAPDRVIRRKKSPLRNTNNNNVNTKNNNRMSYPIGRDRSQPHTEDLMSKSTDRIESGELVKEFFFNF